MSDPHPPQPDPSRPHPEGSDEPREPEEPGAARGADEEPPEAEAEPYDAASETGPVFEAREPGTPAPDHRWAVGCHLVSLLWLLMPVAHLLAPLAIWYFVKRDDPEVEHHAKEAFHFQANMLLWTLVGGLMVLTCLLSPFGLLVVGTAMILAAVMPIVAAVKASAGERYRYPLIVRFLE